MIFWYLIYKLINFINIKNNKIYIEIIILFLLFNLFNFSSIASYLIIVFIISLIYNPSLNSLPFIRKEGGYIFWILIFFILTSLFSIYFYSNYFLEEHKFYDNDSYKTNNFLINKIQSENIENNIFENYYNDYEKLCDKLIENSTSAENYFYCGDLLYLQNKNLSINYYNLWIDKLPDLWNNKSQYFDNILINKDNLKHRFFSEKYSNINQILERIWIKK